jgi:LacI family transcriptional regulator
LEVTLRQRESATIYDVADRAGLSIASVSRVLNQRGKPTIDTRERVMKAVRELGYVPDGAALALSRGLKEVVGVVFRRGEQAGFAGEDESPLFDEIVNRGIQTSAHLVGFDVLISLVSGGDAATRLQVLARKADGLIIHDRVISAPQLGRLAALTPIVTLAGKPTPGVLSVRCDNVGGMRALVRHLALDHGFRSFGYVSGHRDSPDNQARARAVAAEASRHGCQLFQGPEWVGDYSAAAGARAISALLAKGTRLPRCIVCANDQTALGVMHALDRQGFRVPEDVAVTGFDDLAFAGHLRPTLTTVRQPIREMGATAFDLLHQVIVGGGGAHNVLLPAVPVLRESCGCSAS